MFGCCLLYPIGIFIEFWWYLLFCTLSFRIKEIRSDGVVYRTMSKRNSRRRIPRLYAFVSWKNWYLTAKGYVIWILQYFALLNSSIIIRNPYIPIKIPVKKQLTLPIVFFSDLNQDFSINKVDGPVEINECILANISETEDLANISRLNLLLSIANEECYQQIKNGRLYLQGRVYILGQLKLLSSLI